MAFAETGPLRGSGREPLAGRSIGGKSKERVRSNPDNDRRQIERAHRRIRGRGIEFGRRGIWSVPTKFFRCRGAGKYRKKYSFRPSTRGKTFRVGKNYTTLRGRLFAKYRKVLRPAS